MNNMIRFITANSPSTTELDIDDNTYFAEPPVAGIAVFPDGNENDNLVEESKEKNSQEHVPNVVTAVVSVNWDDEDDDMNEIGEASHTSYKDYDEAKTPPGSPPSDAERVPSYNMESDDDVNDDDAKLLQSVTDSVVADIEHETRENLTKEKWTGTVVMPGTVLSLAYFYATFGSFRFFFSSKAQKQFLKHESQIYV